ncbi:TIGR04282 family arsenosugar biosynthesis glycosyltransferase [Mariniflexile ostreae]|uniref:TIGR04282 family arsenosugar biosynthesis glycosyltransferase n=1 Tax=Mariniflexile ostreae TaxID=1520892 RepID=A0ABV5FDB2_9FLAO
MTKELLIIFVKNITLGKVKTRLAKTIGNEAAFEVYSALVEVTEQATQHINKDKWVCFSNTIVDSKWIGYTKSVQQGNDLGERMKNAFKKGFEAGYERIVLIGSDLPDISKDHIQEAFEKLEDHKAVFGPAEDGGYYLVGLRDMHTFIFENKPWSTPNLLQETLLELNQNHIKFTTLVTLNDIDTFEDLEVSTFYKSNILLQQKIKQLND